MKVISQENTDKRRRYIMAKKLRTLIAANWKMHGDLTWVFKPADFNALFPADDRKHLDVLICPPATLVASMLDSDQTSVFIGGQDCHQNATGAHTGNVSADMLKDAGASYVIVGHSERRAEGDSDADVNAKAQAAAKAGLIPIICVGETEAQRDSGDAQKVVAAQIKGSVPKVKNFVIAYEPVWAIGTGKTATPDDVEEMHYALRELVGPNVRLLYGGSVKPANAEELLALTNVNGALIGGASLSPDDFIGIAKAVE
jgi:triosephosphate isomerase